MDTAKSPELQTLIEKIKTLLEDNFTSKLIKYYGITRESDHPIQPLEILVNYNLLEEESEKQNFESTREKIFKAIQLDADYLGDWQESFYWFVDRSVYTFFNRVFATRIMEELGLLTESTIKPEPDLGNRSARMAQIQLKKPRASKEEWYIDLLKDVFTEISQKINILFDETDPSFSIWPDGETIEQIFKILNQLNGEIYTAPDAIGWFYHYYVLKFRKSQKTMSAQGLKRPKNTYYLSVLNTVYTPRWMVEFLVDNSLGRWWQETHPSSSLFRNHRYFIKKLPSNLQFFGKKLEELKILDPACGSGNFLLYVFDCLFQMYQEEHPNWQLSKIIESILTLNLYGIDINRRPAQLTALALFISSHKILKERAPNELQSFQMPPVNIFSCDIRIPDNDSKLVYLQNIQNPEVAKIIKDLLIQFQSADEIGSLINVQDLQKDLGRIIRPKNLEKFWDDGNPTQLSIPMNLADFLDQILPIDTHNIGLQIFGQQTRNALSLARVLMLKYDFIFGNPPFGHSIQSTIDKIKQYYPDSYVDLISAFIDQSLRLLHTGGYVAMVTDYSFMDKPKFEEFRRNILLTKSYIQCLCVIGPGTLPNAGNVPTLFILRKQEFTNENCKGLYRFIDIMSSGRMKPSNYVEFFKKDLSAINDWDESLEIPIGWAFLNQRNFLKLPRAVMEFRLNPALEKLLNFFNLYPVLDMSQVYSKKEQKGQIHIARAYKEVNTSLNDKFIRFWFEVNCQLIRNLEYISDLKEVPSNNLQPYVPCSKGGGDIRYYLSNGYIMWWTKESIVALKEQHGMIRNIELLGHSQLHWPLVGGRPRGRFNITQNRIITENVTHCLHIQENIDKFALLAYLNSKFGFFFGQLLTKDRTWSPGIPARFPVPLDFLRENSTTLSNLAKESFELRRDCFSNNQIINQFYGLVLILYADDDYQIYENQEEIRYRNSNYNVNSYLLQV